MISIYGEYVLISHFGTKFNVIVIMRNTVFNPPLLMVFIRWYQWLVLSIIIGTIRVINVDN